MGREEDTNFRLDEHFIVHEEPVTEEQVRIFTEQQTNVKYIHSPLHDLMTSS